MERTQRSPFAGLRVIVADDNRDSADALSMLLDEWGAKTLVSYSAWHAIEQIQRFDPQVIVLDIAMPDLNGLLACREIRQRHGANIGLVAYSGLAQDHLHRFQATAPAYDAYLSKAADPALIRWTIDSVWARVERTLSPEQPERT